MKIFEFESRQEKYLFFSVLSVLILLFGFMIYPVVIAQMGTMSVNKKSEFKSKPSELYKMFKCPCCGQPIDSNCCGMAKQRKEYLDSLLLEGADENKLAYEMVKKFGFDVLMDKSMEQKVKDYMQSNAPENPPKIEFDRSEHNFGTISQANGVISTIFNLKNSGSSDLAIENIDTSCMCTTAKIVYKGQESPIFGMSMHGENPKDFKLVIPPQESAQLKVIYDPWAHGKQTKPSEQIIREVTITSNDPGEFQKKVRIGLTQTP